MISRHLLRRITSHSLSPLTYFLLPISMIFFVDSTMSFIFPIYIEEALGSNTLLGIVMAASSIIGISCDLIFPHVLKKISWKTQLVLGILLSFLFPLLVVFGRETAMIVLFFLASMLWGIYYEFLSFSEQNFMTSEEPRKYFSNAWGILFAFSQLTGILGPILGSFLLHSSNSILLGVVIFLQTLALVSAFGLSVHMHKKKEMTQTEDTGNSFQVLKELKYWRTFAKHVFPVIVVGVWLEAIEATFWTLGGLFGKEMASESGFDWLPIVLYSAPFIFGSLLLSKLNIHTRKKHITHIMLMIAGVALAPLYVVEGHQGIASLLIIISSFALSFAGPLNEAVYSDLMSRAKQYKEDLLGLAKANSSFAYIVMPIVVGYLADTFGYSATFSIVGACSVGIGVVLYFLTPRKLTIPHEALDGVR